jgi:hypothetical protein
MATLDARLRVGLDAIVNAIAIDSLVEQTRTGEKKL